MNTPNDKAKQQIWADELAAVQARQLTGNAGPGVIRPVDIAARSGIETMLGILNGELPSPPIAQTLGFLLVDVADGSATFQGTPELAHYNPLGTVHGGWYATLLDSAMGCAVFTKVPRGRGYTTVELSVNLVRAATPAAGPLRAIGQIIHSGRQIATADGRLVDANGKLYAHATTTCLLFDLPPLPNTDG